MRTFTKSFFAVLALSLIGMACVKAQGTGFAPAKGFKQVNFGIELEGYGLPVYAGMDFGVGENITIGPRIIFERQSDKERFDMYGVDYTIKTSSTYIVPSFRGDYHFSGLINGITNKLDFYGGLTFGYAIWRYHQKFEYNGNDPDFEDYVNRNQEDPRTNSDAKIWAQVGGRYYFSDNWAVQLEFTSLAGGDGALGMTYRF